MTNEANETHAQIEKIRKQSLEYELRSGLEVWRLLLLANLTILIFLNTNTLLGNPLCGMTVGICFIALLKLPELSAMISQKRHLLFGVLALNFLAPLSIFFLEILLSLETAWVSPFFLMSIVAWNFFPWRRSQLNGLSISVFAIISAVSLSQFPEPFSIFTTILCSLAIVFAQIFNHFSEFHKRVEIDERMQLYEELNSREITIAEKSVEGLRLEDLSRQFSPQVVHAIKEGRLCLREGIHRGEICAIFIDIVNSTDRLIRLDKDNVNRVITMFMEDTIKVLLKYDITIDKFLGDGVLAFSNDPVEQDDYVERVLRAAFEIRARINNRQEEYLDTWLNNLNIRIGIAAGFANVGFYGSNDYFKSYTAIGRVVNLASRICAFAGVNQILLSQEAAKQIEGCNYNLTSLGRHRLRGFSDDLLAIYTVEETAEHDSLSDLSIISQCPKGHGILALDRDHRGIYHLSCRVCGYVEDHRSPMSNDQEFTVQAS